MAKQKERTIGKQQEAPPKKKNWISTVVISVIFLGFFILNNFTRSEPERGPYPPSYKKNNTTVDSIKADTLINRNR